MTSTDYAAEEFGRQSPAREPVIPMPLKKAE
jgi:hypothetical protein